MNSNYWKKMSQDAISKTVFQALEQNVSFYTQDILGVPASHLDSKVFSADTDFVKDKPFLSALINNPNHIGCHTLDSSESFFNGTQAIEKEVINICAYDILNGHHEEKFDGYVASGGTEANLQAVWVYRNYFIQEYKANLNEIAIIGSSDTHYSIDKATNVLQVDNFRVPVDVSTRCISEKSVSETIDHALENGKKYFIIIANMMTTMFGSVDDPDIYTNVLNEKKLSYKLHVDGAYGGFFYPFSNPNNNLNFTNPNVSSVTLDAHKMAQAPYGTGLFIIKKGLIGYTKTKEAKYVAGEDYTLVGSRSGANAIAIWMILMKHGPNSWFEKILILSERTKWFCNELIKRDMKFYRNRHSNIITIASNEISKEIADEFMLVPNNHHNPEWYKIVVMEHVTIEKLKRLFNKISSVQK